ncbi:MAG: glycosyltransferase family 2 protein, partial [Pseudomonadota bacterium]
FGSGHWCLTVDCDELLVYPDHPSRNLHALTGELDRQGVRSFRAVMIELYPKGKLSAQTYKPGSDPADVLAYFDADGFTRYPHPEFHSLIEKGGVRARYFFEGIADHAPPMHKTPLVKWRKPYAYADSTHTILPRWLNRNYGPDRTTGALLHTKFLPSVVAKSADPAHRAAHFAHPARFASYYDALSNDPDFWHEGAIRYRDWETLTEHGLMSPGDGR